MAVLPEHKPARWRLQSHGAGLMDRPVQRVHNIRQALRSFEKRYVARGGDISGQQLQDIVNRTQQAIRASAAEIQAGLPFRT
jgi:hypothetical protein